MDSGATPRRQGKGESLPNFRDMEEVGGTGRNQPRRHMQTNNTDTELDEDLHEILKKARLLVAQQGRDWVNEKVLGVVERGPMRKSKDT
ncbi:hypothetical protein NDU88_003085 [Pleurodeles waltl]|uniref:Uncharacterized protein n=1 Tax=Pleurodeles waltl TaxID=8319 RepID=A0AAV7VGG6_PLEWA|nr:hypothetical protein NDU88_003085 [Pleurodeles waltl]